MTNFVVIGILTGSAYALLALGFVLVYRGTGVFNLAHGEIGGVGLYTAWALTDRMPVLLASVVGIAVSALTGAVMERTLIHRLVDRSPVTALATTLGAALTFAYLEGLWFGFTIKTISSPVGNATFRFGSVTVTSARVAPLVLAAVVGAGLAAFLRRTRFGLAVAASTSDHALARLSGVPVDQTRTFVWALAGALAGAAAILLAVVHTFHPFSSTMILVPALAAALLGGLDSLPGAVIGGLAIGVIESLVIFQTSVAGAADTAIVLIILATLLIRPHGLLAPRDA